MPKLFVKHPEKGETIFDLAGDRTIIGRRPDNTVQINHGTVSGHHAEIIRRDGHWILKDLDSTNRTWFDGQPVQEIPLIGSCDIVFGTIPCQFIADAKLGTDEPKVPLSTGTGLTMPIPVPLAISPAPAKGTKTAAESGSDDLEALRKSISILRQQNEELLEKLAEQQKQIDILGSARLVTSRTTTDPEALRNQIRTLQERVDHLTAENGKLRAKLAEFYAHDPSALSQTARITLPARPAPNSLLAQLAELSGRTRNDLAKLRATPGDGEALRQLGIASRTVLERVTQLCNHPATRLGGCIEALVRDLVQREKHPDASHARSLEQALGLFAQLLEPSIPERMARAGSMQVLAFHKDRDALNTIQSALQIENLPVRITDQLDQADAWLGSDRFNLVYFEADIANTEAVAGTVERIRRHAANIRTPVVLTVREADFDAFLSILPQTASDLIAVPFNMFELSLKSRVHALRHALNLEVQEAKRPKDASPQPFAGHQVFS
jgi:regulator of replication initiation timing